MPLVGFPPSPEIVAERKKEAFTRQCSEIARLVGVEVYFTDWDLRHYDPTALNFVSGAARTDAHFMIERCVQPLSVVQVRVRSILNCLGVSREFIDRTLYHKGIEHSENGWSYDLTEEDKGGTESV